MTVSTETPEEPAVAPAQAGEQSAYSAMQVVARAGITYRQLDYWARTGLAEPSIAAALGSGTQRAYSAADLWRVAIIKTLLDAGLSLSTIREVIDQACEHEDIALSPHARLHVRHSHLADRLHVDPPALLQLVSS